jgi:hypothetical protein
MSQERFSGLHDKEDAYAKTSTHSDTEHIKNPVWLTKKVTLSHLHFEFGC